MEQGVFAFPGKIDDNGCFFCCRISDAISGGVGSYQRDFGRKQYYVGT